MFSVHLTKCDTTIPFACKVRLKCLTCLTSVIVAQNTIVSLSCNTLCHFNIKVALALLGSVPLIDVEIL